MSEIMKKTPPHRISASRMETPFLKNISAPLETRRATKNEYINPGIRILPSAAQDKEHYAGKKHRKNEIRPKKSVDCRKREIETDMREHKRRCAEKKPLSLVSSVRVCQSEQIIPDYGKPEPGQEVKKHGRKTALIAGQKGNRDERKTREKLEKRIPAPKFLGAVHTAGGDGKDAVNGDYNRHSRSFDITLNPNLPPSTGGIPIG